MAEPEMRNGKSGSVDSDSRRYEYEIERRSVDDRRGLLRWDPRAKERRSGKERRARGR